MELPPEFALCKLMNDKNVHASCQSFRVPCAKHACDPTLEVVELHNDPKPSSRVSSQTQHEVTKVLSGI